MLNRGALNRTVSGSLNPESENYECLKNLQNNWWLSWRQIPSNEELLQEEMCPTCRVYRICHLEYMVLWIMLSLRKSESSDSTLLEAVKLCLYVEKRAQWCEKASQKDRTRRSPDCQMFFFFFSSSSDELVQNCMTFSSQKKAILSSAPAHHIFTALKSHEALWTGHWRSVASFAAAFLHTYTIAQKSLSNKTQ